MTAPATTPRPHTERPAAARSAKPFAAVRRPRTGRPAWWAELLLAGIGYALYTVGRNAVPDHRAAALRRAQEILDAERGLHLSFELAVNHAVDRVTWLITGMDYYYATLHFVVTIGVLLWLYVRRPDHFREARTALYAATAAALAGFYLFALAPPRFLAADGFIDTVVVHHTWGSWASSSVDQVSNQYAAMPSVHIVWATWCAVVLHRHARARFVRIAAACYPVATLAVILATANHFEADAAAGLLTIAAGFAAARLLTRSRTGGPAAVAAGG